MLVFDDFYTALHILKEDEPRIGGSSLVKQISINYNPGFVVKKGWQEFQVLVSVTQT